MAKSESRFGFGQFAGLIGVTLLGLGVSQIELLRSLSLPDLARLAAASDVVHCAFTDQDWLWHGILTDTRPESRRQLALVALQPGLPRDWPQRRPARPVT